MISDVKNGHFARESSWKKPFSADKQYQHRHGDRGSQGGQGAFGACSCQGRAGGVGAGKTGGQRPGGESLVCQGALDSMPRTLGHRQVF